MSSSALPAITPRRRRRRRNVVPNLLGWLVFLIAAFPVYWMVLTSFRRGVDIHSPTPSFVPFPGTLNNYRKVFERDFFWTAMKNSLVITGITVALALVIAFLAAVALSRFRFRGRKAFLVTVLVIQMIPAEAMVISLFRVLDGWHLTNSIIGIVATYLHLWKIGLAGTLACGGGHGCELAQFSSYGYFLGHDVALIGAVGYTLIFVTAIVGTAPSRIGDRRITMALMALIVPAFLFTLRLKYGEFIVLRTFCPWCAVSATTITLHMVLVALDWRRVKNS